MNSSLVSNEIKKFREERATIIGQTRVSYFDTFDISICERKHEFFVVDIQ